jgi:hypothetical protein
MAQKQNHDMFSRLSFRDGGGGGGAGVGPDFGSSHQNLMAANGESRPWATGLNWS